MRSHLRTALILLLAAALLAWFLRGADLADVWREMRQGRLDLLAAAVLAVATTYVLRAARWQYLLLPLGRPRFSVALRVTVIGFAALALLPARAGEVVRPYLLARREGFSATSTFATIIVERLLDTLAVLALFASYLLVFDPGMGDRDAAVFGALKVGGAAVGAAAVGGLAVLMAAAGHPERLGRWALNIERVLPARLAKAVARLVQLFTTGLGVVRQPGRLLAASALSLPLWLAIAAGVWFATRAFGIEMPFPGSFLLLALLVVGVAVPTPGAVGGFHEAYRIGATVFFGVPNDRAVGAAIVLHAISFILVAIAGVVLMAQEGLSLSRMSGIAASRTSEEQA
ncbi:MAG: lysylphosphatidylglycerol synthase transmembrane domain-containing protein [Acidobacteriota bacterium]